MRRDYERGRWAGKGMITALAHCYGCDATGRRNDTRAFCTFVPRGRIFPQPDSRRRCPDCEAVVARYQTEIMPYEVSR